MGESGQIKYEGWEKIDESLKIEVEDTSWDRKLILFNDLLQKLRTTELTIELSTE